MDTNARGIAIDVTPEQIACVQLLKEVLHLLVGEVTQLTIEIMVIAVMVRSSETQVIVAVNIPLTVIALPVPETVSNVTGFNHLVAHAPTVPQAKVRDTDDSMGQHHAKVSSLVIKIVIVQFATQFVLLVRVSYFGILLLQKVSIVSDVDVEVRPDNVFHSATSFSW